MVDEQPAIIGVRVLKIGGVLPHHILVCIVGIFDQLSFLVDFIDFLRRLLFFDCRSQSNRSHRTELPFLQVIDSPVLSARLVHDFLASHFLIEVKNDCLAWLRLFRFAFGIRALCSCCRRPLYCLVEYRP